MFNAFGTRGDRSQPTFGNVYLGASGLRSPLPHTNQLLSIFRENVRRQICWHSHNSRVRCDVDTFPSHVPPPTPCVNTKVCSSVHSPSANPHQRREAGITAAQEQRQYYHVVPRQLVFPLRTQAAETARSPAAIAHDARQDDGAGGGARDEWEGAEIVVVGEGGCAMPGRRKLEWCGPCAAHVLFADMEVGKTSSQGNRG